MKLVCILGSARKGSGSTKIALETIKEIEKYVNIESSIYNLNDLDFKGCCGCILCKTALDSCSLNDGLTPVLEDVRDANILILTSPVYYGHISGQLKCFIDRSFSYLEPDFMVSKNPSRIKNLKYVYYVQTQGAEDADAYESVCDFMKSVFSVHNIEVMHSIKAIGSMMPDAKEQMEETISEVKNIVKEDFS